MELTAKDCRNAVALINRAQTTGQEAEEVSMLKHKLLDFADFIEADDERQANAAFLKEVCKE